MDKASRVLCPLGKQLIYVLSVLACGLVYFSGNVWGCPLPSVYSLIIITFIGQIDLQDKHSYCLYFIHVKFQTYTILDILP